MAKRTKELTKLNDQLSEHMDIILKCTTENKKYGKLLLASPPSSRYPYVYPRDTNCAVQLMRRLAGSTNDYDCREQAFEIMKSMAYFMKDCISEEGSWGQRYSLEGEDKSLYKQEDNVAHGIAIICNYLLTARFLKRPVENMDDFFVCINKALDYSYTTLYEKELNLFYSTTSIHESAMEEGYTCWVNFSFLYAYSLANEVADKKDKKNIIRPQFLNFRHQFLYSVSELFIGDNRYIRRTDPDGKRDMRPDFTLLSPFYFGFLHYKIQMENSVHYLEKQLWDPELGMIMRYLPFYKDFSTHVHAGNGPWLQYTAILAQFHYWNGNISRGDELLKMIDSYKNEKGEIPEHLSTCRRFEEFMEREWNTGIDFEKEFYKPILLDNVDFNKILEEANNMHRSYEETGSSCIIRDITKAEGGYIQFAAPLMWSHAEYARALLVRAGDWWKIHKEE
jgi:GH15 family glucan-1,4-alpha-glucosidase